MSRSQSDALAHILAETATKTDLARLEERIDARFALARAELERSLHSLKADLTWRSVAGIAFFAAVMTVLDLFVD